MSNINSEQGEEQPDQFFHFLRMLRDGSASGDQDKSIDSFSPPSEVFNRLGKVHDSIESFVLENYCKKSTTPSVINRSGYRQPLFESSPILNADKGSENEIIALQAAVTLSLQSISRAVKTIREALDHIERMREVLNSERMQPQTMQHTVDSAYSRERLRSSTQPQRQTMQHTVDSAYSPSSDDKTVVTQVTFKESTGTEIRDSPDRGSNSSISSPLDPPVRTIRPMTNLTDIRSKADLENSSLRTELVRFCSKTDTELTVALGSLGITIGQLFKKGPFRFIPVGSEGRWSIVFPHKMTLVPGMSALELLFNIHGGAGSKYEVERLPVFFSGSSEVELNEFLVSKGDARRIAP